jgi:hypothetical protein
MYLSLYGVLWSLGIQYIKGKSSDSLPEGMFKKELGINGNTASNTTYKPTSFDKDEIPANHRSFMTSLNIPSGKESEDLPYLYWIPKLHKTP